ncbi:MAG: AsnC family transcriptional regulator, partial [Oscillospiraceae bacterium]|nr:AsnC family transcriptional regulator [Oscillospiraceae bacterium]
MKHNYFKIFYSGGFTMDTLINLLKQNARLSCKELAAMTGASESEVEAKIKEYEHNGIIKGYSAIINDEVADKNSV